MSAPELAAPNLPIALGVDIGTTTITAVAFDLANECLLAKASALNAADATPESRRAEGWAELDFERALVIALEVLAHVVQQLGETSKQVRAIGITGQMHGTVLLDQAGTRSLRPAITWQDQRAVTLIPEMLARIGGTEAYASCGCLPATGYLGATLFWLQRHNQLPTGAIACCVPDAVAVRLAGCTPVMGDSLAASAGVFDIVHGEWSRAWLDALGLPSALLPLIVPSGAPIGNLSPMLARRLGLPEQVTIHAALGDHQASLIGSGCTEPGCLHLNVGTSAQVSLVTDSFAPPDPAHGIETRPFIGGRYLRSGAVLSGGQTFAVLLRFFRSVFDMFNVTAPEEGEMYAAMVQAALGDGAGGIHAETTFDGARYAPDKRASLTGLTRANFTAANLCRAITQGVAEELWQFAQAMGVQAGLHPRALGAGNAVRRNAALRQALAKRFGIELIIPPWEEEAAVGAARLVASYS